MRPLAVVDRVCGKTGADSSSGGMSAHVPLLVEAAPQRPQVACERVRREVACHCDVPLLEVAPLKSVRLKRNIVDCREYATRLAGCPH